MLSSKKNQVRLFPLSGDYLRPKVIKVNGCHSSKSNDEKDAKHF